MSFRAEERWFAANGVVAASRGSARTTGRADLQPALRTLFSTMAVPGQGAAALPPLSSSPPQAIGQHRRCRAAAASDLSPDIRAGDAGPAAAPFPSPAASLRRAPG